MFLRKRERSGVKNFIGAVFFLVAACAAHAQDVASNSLTKGTWELAAFGGGGTGLNHAIDTKFLFAGGRVGRVMTSEHLHGWLRGNFEYAADFLPVYIVFAANGQNIYGGSFKPVIFQWNFTSGKRIAPYIQATGGVLFSTSNVPPGNTSTVNFTPQGVFGAHIFVKPKRAVLLEAAIVHHSNASLGTQNPGYNASFFFTIGYSWFK